MICLGEVAVFFLTFLRLFDTMIVSRRIFLLYFFVSSPDFFLMVLHISAYSIRCLSSLVSTISWRFVIRARAGDNILDCSGLLFAVATSNARCWIMYVMFSLMVSMSSSSCSVSNRFLNSSWISIFFHPICVVSTLGGLYVLMVFLSTSTSNWELLVASLWSLPM